MRNGIWRNLSAPRTGQKTICPQGSVITLNFGWHRD